MYIPGFFLAKNCIKTFENYRERELKDIYTTFAYLLV